MEIEDDRHPDDAERERGKDEEVGQGVDLDETVAASPVCAGQGQPGADEKRQVLTEICAEPGTLVALDAQPADGDAIEDLVGRIVARRRANTSTARPVATIASASRRTRGSSS